MAKKTPDIITSDAEFVARHRYVGRKHGRVVLPVLAAIVIGVGGAVGWYLLRDKPSAKDTTDNSIVDSAPKETVSQIATDQAYRGDYNGAMQLLDKNIATATDSREKSELLSTKATIAYNAEKYQDALKFAQAADAVKSTHSSLVLAAQSAEALGNKKLAITYYQKLVDTTKTYEVEEYQAKVDELSK